MHNDPAMTPSIKTIMWLLISIIKILAEKQLNKNSKNSSLPPALDMHRKKVLKKPEEKKATGGQKGHIGTTLMPVEKPDEVVELFVNRSELPQDSYKNVGYESRQSVEIRLTKNVIEYRAEVLENSKKEKFKAEFPKHVRRSIQYGPSVKSHSVYLSQYQLMPFNRLTQYFRQMNISIAEATLYHFNKEAYELLQTFEEVVKKQLLLAALLNTDETSVNIDGKNSWLHTLCNELFTLFAIHKNRGSDAMDEMNVLPHFNGVVVHDGWKAYWRYDVQHALCNAHLIRDLQGIIDHYNHTWAKELQTLLLETNKQVSTTEKQILSKEALKEVQQKYKMILESGQKEIPPPETKLKKNGEPSKKVKKHKASNLWERFHKYEHEILRFAMEANVPFTNNRAENDLRMTKVHQKISGCFRSEEGAKIFCRIRSYLLSAQKHGYSPTEALDCLFNGALIPPFQKLINEQAE
jgi:transposase